MCKKWLDFGELIISSMSHKVLECWKMACLHRISWKGCLDFHQACADMLLGHGKRTAWNDNIQTKCHNFWTSLSSPHLPHSPPSPPPPPPPPHTHTLIKVINSDSISEDIYQILTHIPVQRPRTDYMLCGGWGDGGRGGGGGGHTVPSENTVLGFGLF